MAKASQHSQFILMEKDGYREREVFEADNLEDMAEFLSMKTGVDVDPEEVSL